MKKGMLFGLMFVLLSCGLVYAEPSFDQIQTLIKNHEYSAAEKGLELIIQGHPRSAKAYYAMSQAQAGLGNQAKAKEALDMATGIDPKLKFASSGNIDNLKEAITPQTKKIEAVESHTGRNIFLVLLLIGSGIGCYYYFRKKEEDEPKFKSYPPTPEPKKYETEPVRYPGRTNVNEPYFKTPVKDEPNFNRSYERGRTTQFTPTPVANHTTVINNGTNNNGFVDGMVAGALLDSALSNHHHTERVVEREYIPVREVEVVREREVPSRSSSWDEPKEETKSSSWDSGSSSSDSSSSSWD